MSNRIHEITAYWLQATDEDEEKRVVIKNKFIYCIKKDWDYDWSKYPKEICYRFKPKEKYRFIGYCQDKYAFKLLCKDKECGWSHLGA